MRFHIRIITSYSLLFLAIVLVFGAVFWGYGLRQVRESTLQDMSFVCATLSGQLETEIRSMEFATEFFLSNSETLTSVKVLATSRRDTGTGRAHINLAKKEIQVLLYTYFVDQSYYRFNYFNPLGDYLTSDFLNKTVPDGGFRFSEAKWLDVLEGSFGRPVILPPREDPWPMEPSEPVFSVLRQIQGNPNLGYLEVQQTAARLEEIFGLSAQPELHAVVVNEWGEALYSSLDETETRDRLLSASRFGGAPESSGSMYWREQGARWLSVWSYSPHTGCYVILLQEEGLIPPSISALTGVIASVTLIVFLFSLLFIFLTAKRLASPIRQLKDRIDQTSLENLEPHLEFSPNGNDEIQSLQGAYTQLIKRLQASIDRETRLASLQLLAHFDSLQAQVNPHFLYNVLNIISYRGVLHRDETICDICDNLAAMLRYSTDTTHRYATVLQEIQHLQNYFFLLKTRYLDRLEYTVSIDPAVQGQTLPKIVLQQIVENCVNHGFANTTGAMRICVEGEAHGERWLIRVCDNGQGFDPLVLEQLRGQIKEQRRQTSYLHSSDGMEIGGMGLLNTFLRLSIIYRENLHFALYNSGDGGAVVEIGSVLIPGQ